MLCFELEAKKIFKVHVELCWCAAGSWNQVLSWCLVESCHLVQSSSRCKSIIPFVAMLVASLRTTARPQFQQVLGGNRVVQTQLMEDSKLKAGYCWLLILSTIVALSRSLTVHRGSFPSRILCCRDPRDSLWAVWSAMMPTSLRLCETLLWRARSWWCESKATCTLPRSNSAWSHRFDSCWLQQMPIVPLFAAMAVLNHAQCALCDMNVSIQWVSNIIYWVCLSSRWATSPNSGNCPAIHKFSR